MILLPEHTEQFIGEIFTTITIGYLNAIYRTCIDVINENVYIHI